MQGRTSGSGNDSIRSSNITNDRSTYGSSTLANDFHHERRRQAKDAVPLGLYGEQDRSVDAIPATADSFLNFSNPSRRRLHSQVFGHPNNAYHVTRSEQSTKISENVRSLDLAVPVAVYTALVTESRIAIDPFDEFNAHGTAHHVLVSATSTAASSTDHYHQQRSAQSSRRRWVSAGGHLPLSEREEIEIPHGVCLDGGFDHEQKRSMSREEVQQGLDTLLQTQRMQPEGSGRRSRDGTGQTSVTDRWRRWLRHRRQSENSNGSHDAEEGGWI